MDANIILWWIYRCSLLGENQKQKGRWEVNGFIGAQRVAVGRYTIEGKIIQMIKIINVTGAGCGCEKMSLVNNEMDRLADAFLATVSRLDCLDIDTYKNQRS